MTDTTYTAAMNRARSRRAAARRAVSEISSSSGGNGEENEECDEGFDKLNVDVNSDDDDID
eukprot:3594504-Ditylum_brightwellii.AAC.1